MRAVYKNVGSEIFWEISKYKTKKEIRLHYDGC